MRCEEIQERFVELLYNEHSEPSESAALREHVNSCPRCSNELRSLETVRGILQLWQDEEPAGSVALPRPILEFHSKRASIWRLIRYAAVAAMAVLAILALANAKAEFSWSKGEFSFQTRLFRSSEGPSESYTKAEVRNLLKRVLDDSESRMMETNYLMMQQMMDTIDQERMRDLRLIRSQSLQNHAKN